MMALVLLIISGITAYLVGTMIRSIANERQTNARLWKNFGLSLGFCTLFFISWIGHGLAEWEVFSDEQRAHEQEPAVGDFMAQFARATLENWQSEFLQLFSFTVMAAVLIHKGSAESRDSDDLIQASLKRIEDKLGTEPTMRDEPLRMDKDLHVFPDSFEGWYVKDGSSSEPEAYFDHHEQAIDAARKMAGRRNVNVVVHNEDGSIRGS